MQRSFLFYFSFFDSFTFCTGQINYLLSALYFVQSDLKVVKCMETKNDLQRRLETVQTLTSDCSVTKVIIQQFRIIFIQKVSLNELANNRIKSGNYDVIFPVSLHRSQGIYVPCG